MTPRIARLLRALPIAMLPALPAAPPALAQPPEPGAIPAHIDLADEVLYQIMPCAWRDSDNDPIRFGDFNGMTASLGYLHALGVTGLWTTPVFPSPAYHGYQHLEADRVNPRMGSEQDFLAFVHAAHSRGIKVYIDLVAYGISQQTTYFTDSYKNPASPFSPWLAYKDPANTTYQGYTFTTWDGSKVGFVHWNLNTPEPRDLVTRWAAHWLDPNADADPSDGVDGFRLDHVWHTYKEGPNGWGYNVADFWSPWKTALRSINPRVVTFAEQARWESTGADLLDAFDAAFTKPFELAARQSLRTGDASHVADAMTATLASQSASAPDAAGRRGTFFAILGDHDVDRLAGDISPPGAPADHALRRPKLAALMLLTQPFPPIIYMGDELGMLGARQHWGSDANDIPVREPFKWNAVAGPPMTDYWRPSTQAVEHAFSKDNDGRSVEEQSGVPGSLLETYRTLITLRRSTPALRRGEYLPVTADAPSVWSFIRRTDSETMLIAINLKDEPVRTRLSPHQPLGAWDTWRSASSFQLTPDGPAPAFTNGTIDLPPLGGVVLRLDRFAGD